MSGRYISILKQYRLDSGVDAHDVAKGLGMAYNAYLLRENDKRILKDHNKNEQFFYDACHMIYNLHKRLSLTEVQDKRKAMRDDFDTCDSLTPSVYAVVKGRLRNGGNLICICSDYNLDYQDVESQLIKDGLPQYTLEYPVEGQVQLPEYAKFGAVKQADLADLNFGA